MASLIDYLESIEPSDQPFQPYAYYGEEEDALKVYFREDADYAKRLNSRVTIYLSLDNDELVGIQIKNVKQVLEDLRFFDVAVEHGKMKVKMLFVATREEFSGNEDSRKLYHELGRNLSANDIEFAVPGSVLA